MLTDRELWLKLSCPVRARGHKAEEVGQLMITELEREEPETQTRKPVIVFYPIAPSPHVPPLPSPSPESIQLFIA